MKSASFREIFSEENGRALLPELALVGWARHSRARVPGLTAHVHPDQFEIFLIERGQVEWWVEEEVHRLPAHHLYLNRPGERHGSVGQSFKPCGYLWIQLRLLEAAGQPDELAAIHAELRELTLRSFASSPATREAFHALWALHREPPPHAALALRAQLHLLLVRVVEDYRLAVAGRRVPQPGPKGDRSFAIRQALRAVETRLGDITAIAQLAKVSGLGVTQFSERFLEETGFTPAHYLRRQRIERAKRLLRAGGTTLAAIAHATGFSSSQHLATVFKQIEGLTPTAYMRQHADCAEPGA